MKRIIAYVLMACLAGQVWAQSEENTEKGRVELWLEEALSAAGRDVTISGFRGAFSSEASFEQMTIADDEGTWLTINNATLIWSRSALLSGRVDINEISADEIAILRKPTPAPAISTEDSQSWTFEVPELPISLEIDKIDVASVLLDASIVGQEVDLSISGNAQLAGGAMAVDVEALRKDAKGRFAIIANFANETRELDLDVSFKEPAQGVVAELLNIPDSPALELSLKGAAPLSDFGAKLSLSTDDVARLEGDIQYQEGGENADLAQSFGARLAGDLRPLFASDFHEFFGAESALLFQADRALDGALDVTALSLETGVLNIEGALALGADKLPDMFDLRGVLTSENPVRLPTSGAPMTVAGLQLSASFDASKSDAWTADVSLSELVHEGLTLPTAKLSGSGTIDRSLGKQVSGEIEFELADLIFNDPHLARAFDGAQSGRLVFAWEDGADLVFEKLELNSATAHIVASGALGALTEGLPIKGRASADVDDLGPFSGLAGRPLGGSAQLDVAGRLDIIGGGFDVELSANTTNLSVSETRLDPLVVGEAKVALSAARDPEGTELRNLDIRSQSAEISASGRIDPAEGALDLYAKLSDLSLVEPKIAGAGNVKSQVLWNEVTGFELRGLEADIAGSQISGDLAYDPEGDAYSGQIDLMSADISALAKVTGRDLSGGLDLKLSGGVAPSQQSYQIDVQLKGNNLQVGLAQIDPLLAGALAAKLSASAEDNRLEVRELAVTSPLVSIVGNSGETLDELNFEATIRDIAPIAPGFSGRFDLSGSAQLDEPGGRDIDVTAKANGPAGLTLTTSGRVFNFGERVDLTTIGRAPLGLANRFIAPNSVQGDASFDLSINGAPGLNAVSGRVDFSGGRVALPDSGLVLAQVNGAITMAGAQAQIDITGNSSEGGTFRVSGPLSLDAGNRADLAITLSRFGITDPELFATSLSGQVNVTGPLTGAGRIAGALTLGTTEVVVPTGSSGAGGAIPDINHINPPSGVRATLKRAGVEQSAGSSARRAFDLDVTLSAPNQIFVRGRGLDAELGGQLRIGGTSSDVTPSGNFELIRGRFDILGRRFVMTEGLINLRGSLDPFLRFVAQTQTEEGSVSLILEGLASDPDLRFESDPDMPQEEAIAQLLFGRDLANISALQAASLVSAIATLSGRNSGGVTGRLRNALGLSDFDVTTTESGARQLRAGAYINENIYSEITIDSEGNQAIELNLDITPNIRAKGGTNSEGNTGIGIFFEKDY